PIAHPALPPFPTRRSSDLCRDRRGSRHCDGAPQLHDNVPRNITTYFKIDGGDYAAAARQADQVLRLRLVNNRLIPTCLETRAIRSEEHTSELQSPDHLVCR